MRRTPRFLPPPPTPRRDGHMQFIMQKHPCSAGVGGQEGRYPRCSALFQKQQVPKVPDSEKYIFRVFFLSFSIYEDAKSSPTFSWLLLSDERWKQQESPDLLESLNMTAFSFQIAQQCFLDLLEKF